MLSRANGTKRLEPQERRTTGLPGAARLTTRRETPDYRTTGLRDNNVEPSH
jgi:hypothetical protein